MFQRALAQLYFETGRWDDALAEAYLPDDIDEPLHRFLSHNIAAVIAFHRGDPAAPRHVTAAAQLADRVAGEDGQWLLTRALGHEVSGDLPAALAVLSDGLTKFAGLSDVVPWLADAVRLAAALAAMSHVPYRIATAAHCRGLLDADPALLLSAAEDYGRVGRPLPQAQALEAATVLLAERGDLAAARAQSAAALDIYGELGAQWDSTRARARFRSLGVRQPTRRLRRPTTGWDALTTAEKRVVQLVAQGMSNPAVAEQLVLSPRTVELHVTRALGKLGVRSRIELTRAVADYL
jgi:DNA-binding CsgD family transcriptional regulator